MRKKTLAILLAFSMVCSMGGFGGASAGAAKRPALNKKKVTLEVGDTVKLSVKKVSKKKIKKKVFRSNKPKTASVSKSGKVEAKKEGKAVVTCVLTLKNKRKYKLRCQITVEDTWEEEDNETQLPVETGASAQPSAAVTVQPGQTVVPTGSGMPQETAGPNESIDPQESGQPGESSDPQKSEKPSESGAPQETAGPNESGSPEKTDMPDVSSDPQKSQDPSGSGAPQETNAPKESGNPEKTNTPDVSSDPQKSQDPSGSGAPQETAGPNESTDPQETAGPNESTDPQETAGPNESTDPQETAGPNESTDPQESKAPITTAKPMEEHLSANGILTSDNGEMRADMTAFKLIHEMGIGINLGNTMESVGDGISSNSVSNYEKAWGAPITTQKMISGMKQAGFSSIRIPVAWSNMMSSDGTYQINEDYFDRVEEIMNYALREDMYVIVNIHYDGGWWARFGSKDASERAAAMDKYKAMWTQIANRYQEYSDKLIFESANEEIGSRLNSTDDYAGSGYFTSTSQLYEMVNKINQTFVNIVRGTGGNNSMRYLLLAGYDTDIAKTCDGSYEIPEDTIEDHLMVSVHYYSPATYCIADKKDNGWGYMASWGTDADIQGMKDELENLKICFTNKGIPVIIGEYGVAADVENGHIKEGRDKFFRTICEYSLENGICPVLWDITDPVNCVYNRSTCKMSQDNEAKIYQEMAEKAADSEIFVPAAKGAAPYWTGTVAVNGWNPVAPTAGEGCTFTLSQMGAAYSISQVNWDDFENPVLVLHAENGSGSVNCNFSRELNQSNEYWPYIEKAEKSVSWNMSKDIEVDLSSLELQKKQSLYFEFKTGSLQTQLTMKVLEKKN